MANTIRIKRSTGSSNPGSLENAEVAFREGDEVLIYGTGTGGSGGSATSIIPIGGKGAFFDKATTSATTYKIQLGLDNTNSTWYINRYHGGDSYHGTSSLTLYEVTV